MNKHRLCAALLCLLLLCAMLPTTVFAYGRIDTSAPASLTISYRDSGVNFRLYRVAEVSDTVRFTFTGDFQSYQDLQASLDAWDWDNLVLTLQARVIRDGIQPLAAGTTDKNGNLTFSGLDTGLYLVLGQTYIQGKNVYAPQPFLVSLPDLNDEDQWDYDVTVFPKPGGGTPVGENVTIQVQKVWMDEGHTNQRPKSVTVDLYKDGKVYDTVTLNQDNNWRHTWTGLSAGHTWTVAERNVPAGYDDTYSRNNNSFVIVNTYEDDTPEGPGTSTTTTTPTQPGGGSSVLPQTGLLWWPVSLLTIGGILLFLVGWVKYRKYGEPREKGE